MIDQSHANTIQPATMLQDVLADGCIREKADKGMSDDTEHVYRNFVFIGLKELCPIDALYSPRCWVRLFCRRTRFSSGTAVGRVAASPSGTRPRLACQPPDRNET